METLNQSPSRLCIMEYCEEPWKARSLCQMHYNMWHRGAITVLVPRPMTHAEAGAIGGRNGHTGGFYANRELARTAGAKGGRISRRTKVSK